MDNTETLFKPKRRGRPSRCPDIDTLSDLYAVKTSTEIAELLGVPRDTVRGWIRRARKAARAAAAEKKAAGDGGENDYDDEN